MNPSDRLSSGGLSLLSGFMLLIIVVVTFALATTGTDHDVRPLSQQRTVSLAATPDLAPIFEVVAARFAESHDGSRVKIDTLSASAAMSELVRGRIHVVVAARELHATDHGLQAFPIVRDGVTVAVHQSNSIQELSDTDIADILVGRLQNWKFVGGEDAAIDLKKAAAGRSETEALLMYLKLDNIPRRLESVHGDSERLLREVARNPAAVGVSSIATALRLEQRGMPMKLLKIRGVEPTLENIEQGNFPVTLPVNLIIKSDGNAFAREFVAFARSADVRELFTARRFAAAPL